MKVNLFKFILPLLFAAAVFGSVEVSAQGWLDKALKKVDNAVNQVDKALNTGTQQQTVSDSAAVTKQTVQPQQAVMANAPQKTGTTTAKPVVPIATDWEKGNLNGNVKSMIEKETVVSKGKTVVSTSTSTFTEHGMLLTFNSNCGTASYTYNEYHQPVDLKITLLSQNMGWQFAGEHYMKSGNRTFKYDNKGRLTESAFAETKNLYSYNEKHFVEKKEEIRGNYSTVHFYAYDADGRVTAEYLGEITQTPANAYAYNARGQLTSLKENGFEIEKHQYNDKGDVIRDETTNYSGDKYIVTYTYLYDSTGKWTKCTSKNLGKITAVDTRSYDSKGNWTEQITRDATGKTLKTVTRTFAYYPESNQPAATTGLNIPKTTGILTSNDDYDMYDKRKRITPAERTSLKIASINSKYFDVKWPNTQLSAGKQIYSGKEGRLQTILYIHKDTKEQGVEEFLVSYDSSGNPVDCILIAAISAYWGDAGEGTIEGNTVNALYVDRSEGTNYRIYQISPGLKFVKVKEGE